MKRSILLLLALAVIFAFPVKASAAEVTEASVPVTLTVVNTVAPISVTVPACLPVSLVNGYVVTANNAKIVNTAEEGSIRVTGVTVKAGAFSIGNYESFAAAKDSIALSINSCPTTGPGKLTMAEGKFPDIHAGEALPIVYAAKVATTENLTNANAATVIFTIAACREEVAE